MTTGLEIDSLSLIAQLQIDIERAKKAPPFRKLEAAECALESAVAVLLRFERRISSLEKDFCE